MAVVRLSEAQERAFQAIRAAFARNETVLLNGVTGSGKTEIYIHLAAETLRRGRNVLYLVPEIMRSRQLETRLAESFGELLLPFNSGRTLAERQHIAEIIRERSYLVLGTRSALFLPHRRLGLVIIDEEHDGSYKQQDTAPRYHGRDTAVVLGRIHRANVILGSATPSLEALYNCDTGRFTKVDLPERYHLADSADVLLIDTFAERRKRGMRGLFSLKLIREMEKALSAGRQILLLRSRRAYSPLVRCSRCGDIPQCPHCHAALSYHKSKERLLCHHCGYSEAFTGNCPRCGGTQEAVGGGTQKVEEETAALFPQARIARLDSDTATSASRASRMLTAFAKGKTDILIGTQIIGKGMDFPNLELVVLLQADSLLGTEDFRADEKALQLLEQFRGRCSRRDRAGKFIIQTSRPEHPIYRQLTGMRPEKGSLVATLLEERKAFGCPPFTRIICLTVSDKDEQRLDRVSTGLYQRLCRSLSIETDGPPSMDAAVFATAPYPPAIDKVADRYLRLIRFSFRKDRQLPERKKRLQAAIAAFEKEAKYSSHIRIDVDPV